MSIKVLVAGLAGASLGTEIVKCLARVGNYEIFGCDISPLAYGLYSPNLTGSFLADGDNYIQSIVDYCERNKIVYIVPGGERPMILLAAAGKTLKDKGLVLTGNTSDLIELFSNKERTFNYLKTIGVVTPWTLRVTSRDDLVNLTFPCIVKPSSGSGGSDSVFLATNIEECRLYVELLIRNNREVIIQEYIGVEEGEYTIGVLSDTKAKVIGSIAMKRTFNSKLSVSYKGAKGLISSGYSQGMISEFTQIRFQAEQIAIKAGSKGPLNIQGRVRDGLLIPFEINPRFSASTYLRNLAGFNEIDFFLRHLANGESEFKWNLREGYYLRSFDQMFLPLEHIKV
jgi:carbamoyl-phosphate synthase large subunit